MYKNILLTVDLEHPKAQLKSVPVAVDLCQQHGANGQFWRRRRTLAVCFQWTT